jgi:membrane peptidoglycan carboxypeptidase
MHKRVCRINALDRALVLGEKTRLAANALSVPVAFLQTLLAIEDRRYWLHPGIDPVAATRAIWMTFVKRGRRQGGSTLPEQLVRLRWQGMRGRTIHKRVTRSLLGVLLVAWRGRMEVLREYLDLAYLGRNYWGIDAAAKGYFGITRHELSAAQGLFLVERLALPNRFRAGRIKVVLSRSLVSEILDESIKELPGVYARAFGYEVGCQVSTVVMTLGIR